MFLFFSEDHMDAGRVFVLACNLAISPQLSQQTYANTGMTQASFVCQCSLNMGVNVAERCLATVFQMHKVQSIASMIGCVMLTASVSCTSDLDRRHAETAVSMLPTHSMFIN